MMNFLKGFDKIVGNDDLRQIIQNVFFKDGCAVATDGHKLVKVDLKLYDLNDDDINSLEGYLLDREVLNEIKLKRNQSLSFSKGVISVFSKGRIKPIKTIELITEEELGSKFVRFEAILGKKELPITAFRLDPKLLLDVENVYNNLPTTEINKREFLSIVSVECNGLRVQNINGSFEALVMQRK